MRIYFFITFLCFQIVSLTSVAQATTKPVATPLPSGVPLTTSGSTNDCFKSGELDQYKRYINEQRVPLAGCSKGVIRPERVIQSYKKGVSGTRGSEKSCINTRKGAFSSGYIDMFLEDVVDLMSSDGSGTNAQCAANMLYYWAQNKAMTDIGNDGGNNVSTSQLARVWNVTGVATAYLVSTRTQDQAKKQSTSAGTKHAVILSWMKLLANNISAEIDSDKDEADHDDELGLTNRHFWRGYAILPIGILRTDLNLLRRSRSVFLSGIHEIEGEGEDRSGFMPEEISRKQNSLHYHAYALQPLMGMALLSKAVKCDFADTSWRKRKLSYLLRKSAQGGFDPQVFVDEVNRRAGRTVIKSVLHTNAGKMMLYWGYKVDNDIFEDAKAYLVAKRLADSSMGYIGGSTSFDRLGGSFSKIASRVDAMRQSSGACPI